MINWVKKFFTGYRPKPNVWKEVKCEYLREYMDFGTTPQSMTTLYVHAVTMICLNTGARKISERYALHKLEEYNRVENQEQMTQEARNTNNYNHI